MNVHAKTLEDVIAQIAQGALPNPLEADSPSGVEFPAALPGVYIAPSLVQVDSLTVPSDAPKVMLISAPAAVGKSWLAKHLSQSTGNPLIDLSSFSVGSGFFSGVLTEALETTGFSKLKHAINSGQRCLILDAADEALVRVGFDNFGAALANLARVIKDAPPEKYSAIILGRNDTVEDAAVLMAELNVSVVTYEVQYFDRATSKTFVRSKCEEIRPVASQELDEFLENFFDLVQLSMGAQDWNEAAPFLGYSPVLDALSTFYLDAPNPMATLQSMRRDSTSGRTWHLLVEVLEAIMLRESNKLAEAFAKGNEHKAQVARSFYSPKTQTRLLLAEELEVDASGIPGIPDDWRPELEEAVRGFIREHPFAKNGSRHFTIPVTMRFSNVAFRDYLYAKSSHEASAPERFRLCEAWRREGPNASPLFEKFLFEGDRPADNKYGSDFLSVLIDSHYASTQLDDARWLWIAEEGEKDEKPTGLLARPHLDESLDALEFDYPANSSINVVRSIASTTILAPQLRLSMGAGSGNFTLGPRVILFVRDVEMEARGVRVSAGDTGEPNLISCAQLTGTTTEVKGALGSLFIAGTPLSFPWHQFDVTERLKEFASKRPKSAFAEAAMELRQLVTWFMTGGSESGRLTYPRLAMEAILAKSRASASLFDYCLSIGAITREGSFYLLKLPIQITSVRQVDLSDKSLFNFLEGYLSFMDSGYPE